ncbi:hypothetical protein, partial [Klebsiella quasipneumoniae]|uniref:hypothetical protein n=1 Tax=Klebsiella quasipneumoniae TaxID=1463165 RepID=UPI0027300A04
QDLETFESLGFLDLGAAMHSLNPQVTTNVKIWVREMFLFSYFSSQLCLVVRLDYVGVWCQDLETFESLGILDLRVTM